MKTVYFLPLAFAGLFVLSFAQTREDLEEKRQEWFYQQRAYPKTELEPGLLLKALQATRADRRLAAATQTSNIVWQSAGPTPIAGRLLACNGTQIIYQNVSGRVSALAADPVNPNVVYCGGAYGGVWKSTDAGIQWMPITENEAIQTVGAIAIDPNNPSTIYIGTGEASYSGLSYYGLGILKSTDGGSSWSRLGIAEFSGRSISRILIDPSNSDRVWTASSLAGKKGGYGPTTGVFLSTDGGATWIQKPVVADTHFVTDLAMEPGNPNVLYAALRERGIFKTSDGGNSWTQLTNGLPASNFRRISLAIAPSSPQRVYSGWAYPTGGFLGVYVSDDFGITWSRLPNFPPGTYGGGGQYNYYNVLLVHPTNPNRAFFGGLHLWATNDSLTAWAILTDGCTPATSTHADHHALAFGPDGTLYDGNDGGVWKTTNEGASWVNLNGSLSLTQFISVALHPNDSSKGVGGSQDNGYEIITGAPSWTQTLGSDGGFCDWNNSATNIIYGTLYYGYPVISHDSGFTWVAAYTGIDYLNDAVAFYAPFKMDPDSAHWVYLGTDRLYRTIDTTHNWVPTTSFRLVSGGAYLTAIAASPENGLKGLAVGANNGQLLLSYDNGTSWSDITRVNTPRRWVTDFEVSSVTSARIIVSFSGFNSHTPGFPGHIFRTTNAGNSWTDISGNLPDVPVNTILADPDNFNTILAGTDIGVFVTFDGGASWEKFGSGLPNVAVFDLRYNPVTKVLAAGTHGRGMYWVHNFDLSSPCTIGDMNVDANFSPADVVLMLNCVFLAQGNCSLCFSDVNCDGSLTPSDVVIELNMVFLAAPPGC